MKPSCLCRCRLKELEKAEKGRKDRENMFDVLWI